VNSSDDDKCWGWAAGRRRQNLARIWISQHLNGTSRKGCPCAKWPLEQVWVPCQPFSTLTGMLRNALRNVLPIFPLVLQNRSTTTGNSSEKLTIEFPADFSTKRDLWKTIHRQAKCWKLSRSTDRHDPKWREFTFRTRRGVGSHSKPFLSKKPRPRPDGRDASRWYGRLRVQELTLSVLNCVHSPGRSFHIGIFLIRSFLIMIVDHSPKALSNGAIPKLNFLVDVSPSCCRYFLYLGFLTGAPTTNFARKRVKTRYLTLFRATKNTVVICGASLLYEMSYSFRSTVFVPVEF